MFNKVKNSYKNWINRPRIISGLWSKEIKIMATGSILTFSKDGIYVKVEGSKLMISCREESRQGNGEIEFTSEAQAMKICRKIFRSLRPAHTRLARTALAATAIFIVFSMFNAPVKNEVEFNQPAAPQASAGQANPTQDFAKMIADAQAREAQLAQTHDTQVQPDTEEMGLPPVPFSN